MEDVALVVVITAVVIALTCYSRTTIAVGCATPAATKEYPYIPKELLHIILAYDGRIKYRCGMYMNVLDKNDERYNTITPIIRKKIEITRNIEMDKENGGFYFEFDFDNYANVGLVYDCNFSYPDIFEICYYDWRTGDVNQIRTYI